MIKLEEIIPTRKNLEFDDSDILKYAEPEYQVHYHSEETTKFNKRQNMLQITDFKKFTPLTVREDVTDATDVYEEGHPYGCLYYDHHSGEVYVSIFGTPKPFQSKVRKVARSKKSLVRNDELKKTIRTMLAKYANLTQKTITIYKLNDMLQIAEVKDLQNVSLETTDAEVDFAIETGDYDKIVNALVYHPQQKEHLHRVTGMHRRGARRRPFSTKKFLKYIKQAVKHFQPKMEEKATNRRIRDTFAQFANHPNITASELERWAGYNDFGIKRKDSGTVIHRHALYMGKALRALHLLFGMKNTAALKYLDKKNSDFRKYKSSSDRRITTYSLSNKQRKILVDEIHSEIDFDLIASEAALEDAITKWEYSFDIDLKTGIPKLKKDRCVFFKNMHEKKFYNSLVRLWCLRVQFNGKTDRLRDFVKFLSTDEGLLWIKYDFCTLFLQHKHGKVQRKFSEVPLIGDFANESVDWLIDQLPLMGELQAKWMQMLLPLLICKWFSPRVAIMANIRVLSERDYSHLMDIANKYSMRKLTHGLFIIVLEDGYRLVKRENKIRTEDRDLDADFDIQGAQLKHPRLLELLPKIHRAFEELTGAKVTHSSTQRNCYISNEFNRDTQKYPILQYHCFPLRFPNRKKNLYYLRPVLPYEHESWAAKKPTIEAKRLSAKVIKATEKQRVKIHRGDSTHEVPLQFTNNVNNPRTEHYVGCAVNEACMKFYYGGLSQGKERLGVINSILRQAANDDSFIFEGKEFSATMSSHVRLCSQKGVLNYRFVGRYHSGDIMNIVYDKIKTLEVPTLTQEFDFQRYKKKKEDAHVTDKIFVDSYRADKTELHKFYRLGPEYSSDEFRWAANPLSRPSYDEPPTANALQTIEQELTLPSRMHDDRMLTFYEQELQHRWRTIDYKYYHELKKYEGRFVRVDAELRAKEAVMKEAQAIWDKKNGKSPCKRIAEALTPTILKRGRPE